MKTISRLMFICMLVPMLTSCLGNAKSDYTPSIGISYILVNPIYRNDTLIGAMDTMNVKYDDKLSAYRLDTLSISKNDTIVFAAGYNSFGNDLIAAKVNFDTTAIAFRLAMNDEFMKVLTDKSDVRNAQLYFAPGYNYVSIPMGYKPIKTGMHTIEFVVESNSKFSPSTLTMIQPVVD